MGMHFKIPDTPHCPRCGYDQRGVVVTWTDSCPLQGTCSECGVSIFWGEILNPVLMTPAWCVESPQAIHRFPMQAMRTFSRTLLPWRLWRHVRMTHPVRWPRMASYLASLIILLYVVGAVSIGASCASNFQSMMKTIRGTATASSSDNAWIVFFRGASQPFSNQPPAIINFPASTVATGGGLNLVYPAVAYPLDPPLGYIRPWLRIWPVFIAVFAVPGAIALAFAALPVSRRQAKVRCVHIGRALLYSYAFLLPLYTLTLMNEALRDIHRLNRLLPEAIGGYIILSPFLFIAYWWAAAGLYLRMHRPLAVALSVTIIGILLPFTILWIAAG